MKKSFTIIALFLTMLSFLCSCTVVMPKTNTGKEVSLTTDNVHLTEHDNSYKNPYWSEETEDIGSAARELYWQLYENGTIFVNGVCRELKEKNWNNIDSCYGFPDKYQEYAVYLTNDEMEKFVYTVKGSIDCIDGEVYIIAIITLSETNPYGEISRVIYTSPGGRDWIPEDYGYKAGEILDAYTVDIWKAMTSY